MKGGWLVLMACVFAQRAGSRQVLYRPMNSASFVAHQEMPVHCLDARCSPLPNDIHPASVASAEPGLSQHDCLHSLLCSTRTPTRSKRLLAPTMCS